MVTLYITALVYLIFIDRATTCELRHNIIPLYSLYVSFKINNVYEIIGNIYVFIAPAVLLPRPVTGNFKRALPLFLMFIVFVEPGEIWFPKGRFDIDGIL
jgi:hypothetical protein